MTTPASKIRLSVTGLNKRFGENHVLKDVSIEVPAGRKTVLIGPAASGKTVLMKCASGIYAPDSGDILLDGQSITSASATDKRQMLDETGVLFQQGGLFDSLKVWENISFKLINNDGVSRREARDIAIEKLSNVNLPASTADLLPSELSGGMQKRVGIARVLASNASLMLLDEPTAGLDPITTKAIYRLLDKSIQANNSTVFAITSDMAATREQYDYLIMLHEGRVMWKGPLSEVDRSANPYVLQLINGQAQGPIKMRLKARA